MFHENFSCLDTNRLQFLNFTVLNIPVGSLRAAPTSSGSSVTSSSGLGWITGSLNTPPPSWRSCAQAETLARGQFPQARLAAISRWKKDPAFRRLRLKRGKIRVCAQEGERQGARNLISQQDTTMMYLNASAGFCFINGLKPHTHTLIHTHANIHLTV